MSADMQKLAIAAAILFVGYKYGNGMLKGAALAIGATIVAKRVPYLQDVV